MRNLFAVIVHRILRAWEGEEEELTVDDHAQNVIAAIKTREVTVTEAAAVEAAAKAASSAGILRREAFYLQLPLRCAMDVHYGINTPDQAIKNFKALYPFEDESLENWLANMLVSYPEAADHTKREKLLVKLAMETAIHVDRLYRRQALGLCARKIDFDFAISESIKTIKEYPAIDGEEILIEKIRQRVADLIP